jgi:hypothetical protein
LESTVNRLSVDASFLHNKTVPEHKKQVFPCSCVIEKDVKVNIMLFESYVLLNFKALVAKT